MDESASAGLERAIDYLINRLPPDRRTGSLDKLHDIVDRYGPVVEGYPSWHPFIWEVAGPCQGPKEHNAGYKGLDHTIYLRDAFITCPYADPEDVVRSAENRDPGPFADAIEAEILDFPLYAANALPVLVTCRWSQAPRLGDRTVPQRVAVGRMLISELRHWEKAEVGETWETMRQYFMGTPCGSRSSLFVSEKTGSAMKKVWQAVIQAGVFGQDIFTP